MTEDRADIFLTYCTNAVLARRDTPKLKIVATPGNLSVGANYGITLLQGDSPGAMRFVLYVLSSQGQRILADYGFTAPTLP